MALFFVYSGPHF